MNAIVERLAAVFHPSGMVFYDIVVPAAIMATGSVLLAVSGIISQNVAFWCFGTGALLHVSLSWLAGFLIRKKDGEHHAKSGNNRG